MSTLINLLLLIILCVHAHTNNPILFIVSFIYLSLATLGCLSVCFKKFRSENLEWPGIIPFVTSIVLSCIVLYFIIGSPFDVWYFCVTCFWHGAAILSKNINV